MDIEEWLSLLMLISAGKYVRWVKYRMGILMRYTLFRLYHEYVCSSLFPSCPHSILPPHSLHTLTSDLTSLATTSNLLCN